MTLERDYACRIKITVPPVGKFDPFYKKYLNANGFPVISSEKVSDEALAKTSEIVSLMLAKCTKAREYMIKKGCHVMVIGATEEKCHPCPPGSPRGCSKGTPRRSNHRRSLPE